MIKLFKKFTHNVLGWGYPTGMVEWDAFQPTYQCECGARVTQDSQGNSFHLEQPNKL